MTSPHANATPDVKSPENPEKPKPDLSHTWIGSATVPLPEKTARRAARYLSYRATADEKINVLEVYCSGCRRNLEDVKDVPCAAKVDNTHLIGGDQAHRKKRKVSEVPESATLIPGPRINRYGIDAVIRGEA